MTTALLPLLSGADLDAPLAWRGGRPVSRRQYLADVRRLADQWPARGPVLAITSDHYRFALAFGSALLRGQSSLLPPNHTPDMVARLGELFPDACVLAEEDAPAAELPTYRFTSAPAQADGIDDVPALSTDAVVAHMLTSGSTGAPTRHDKRWGLLVENISAGAERIARDHRQEPARRRQHRGHGAGAPHVRLRVHAAGRDDRRAPPLPPNARSSRGDIVRVLDQCLGPACW